MQLQFKLDEKSDFDLKLELLEQKLDAVKTSSDKVRRGLFARHGDLSKCYIEALSRIEELEGEVARLRRNVNDTTTQQWLYKTDGHLFALACS